MHTSFVSRVGVLVAFVALLLPVEHFSSVETAHAALPPSLADRSDTLPTALFIPAINLNAPIVPVGTDASGQMAVPSAQSGAVGWYAYGTLPGEMGSAVLDAHVFAAFTHLSQLRPGDDIYVARGSALLHFRVESMRTYGLSSLSPTMLFGASDARRLNLITCAGAFIPSLGTYDHRLVVYATLVS
jgi:LPXTG-site transpeptidase (sortase) family protein